MSGIVEQIKIEVSTCLENKYEELNNDFKTHKKELIEELKSIRPKFLRITLKDKEVLEVRKPNEAKFYHNKFAQVLKTINANIPVFLTGDAGSGKTTLAEQCAESLNLPFYCISVCIQTSETTFLGYKNANGDYVRTLFREAYEHGGVFLIDEIDNGNPNVLSVLNSALANHVCAFPDGMIFKHDNFRLIASGNTIGRGATREYVGRLEMDLATLDRFAIITIDYDIEIEKAISQPNIVKLIQKIRQIVNDKGIRLVVSPRASINLMKLVNSDIDVKEALELCVFKGCEQSIKEQIWMGLRDEIKAFQ